MKKSVIMLATVVLLGAGCSATSKNEATVTTTQENTETTTIELDTQITYTSESWQDIIPSSCQTFSDGCNTCTRSEGSDVAACTRKACMTYERPVCLDVEQEDVQVATSSTPSTRRRVEVLKSNKQGDPDANRYDFANDGYIDPDDDGVEDAQTVTVEESSATDYNSSRSNKSY